MLSRAARLTLSVQKRKQDPALALLVHLAQRVRHARHEKRDLVRRANCFELKILDFKPLFAQACAVENALWNALQGCKEYYGIYTQKETT